MKAAFVVFGIDPLSDPSILRIAYHNIEACGHFDRVCHNWLHMVVNAKTWASFQAHFKAADHDMCRNGTTANAGFYGASNVSHQRVTPANASTTDHMALSTALARQASIGPPPPIQLSLQPPLPPAFQPSPPLSLMASPLQAHVGPTASRSTSSTTAPHVTTTIQDNLDATQHGHDGRLHRHLSTSSTLRMIGRDGAPCWYK
jgi:hypothetical protein